MAVSAKLYGRFTTHISKGEFIFLTDTVKVGILDSTYTPDQNDDYWGDVNAHEVSGTGYTARGKALTSKTVTYGSGIKTTTFDAADVTWAALTLTDARYLVVYKDSGTNNTSWLMGYVDLGVSKTPSNAAVTITWHADGIATLPVA